MYKLEFTTTSKNNSLRMSSGSISQRIWTFLEDKIDLNEFPNFEPPQFVDGREVIS